MCLQRFCKYFLFCCSSPKSQGYNETTFYDCVEPHLIYRNNELGEIKEGTSFTVSGRISKICERFTINLLLDTNDIALHINPRLPQNYIVRNCRVKNIWGNEEVTSGLPFILNRGAMFTIQILITNSEYLISVNGRHFASFHHRLPYNRVVCIEVKGDVERIVFKRHDVNEYPNRTHDDTKSNQKIITTTKSKSKSLSKSSTKSIQNNDVDDDNNGKNKKLPTITTNQLNYLLSNENSILSKKFTEIQLPFYGTLSEKLINGKRLLVRGRVKILPHSFFINLQTGQNIWPHPNIAFHFNPRFANIGGKHVICRNSWSNGKWNQEERTELKTDFSPGKLFNLWITCSYNCYEVYLNEKFIAEFQYRQKPDEVDTIYIQGDIKLWDISLENTYEMNSYENPIRIDDNHEDDGTY